MRISDLRQTHTFVILDLSPAAFEEIKSKLDIAGYQYTFIERDSRRGIVIDMYGIAVGKEGDTDES